MSDTLDRYRRKRDFTVTGEPAPEKPAPPAARMRFVVQRHESRRLHYDFRLEAGGVLLSWAVPKGFSYNPKDKRLAVHVEDHPVAYQTFEGMIPRGEYGGGTVTIWDRGTYEPLPGTDAIGGVAKGEVKIRLYGRRLRGEWHLVRTKPKEPKEDPWLLFKARDRYALERGESELVPRVDLTAAPIAPPGGVWEAMRPSGNVEPFNDTAWIFEAMFAGKRLIAAWEGGKLTLHDLKGRPQAISVPSVERGFSLARAERFVVDGILVALDGGGRPSVGALRAALENPPVDPGAITFYAFDLLTLEEWDLRGMSLLDRKTALASILPAGGALLYLDHVTGDGRALAATMAAAGLDTLLARKADSPYRPGRSAAWKEIPIAGTTVRSDSFEESLAAAEARKPRKARRAHRGPPLTNLDKVFWPEDGFTKGDLIAHYERVAEILLPHLAERPVHMLRHPNGIHGKSFYQRQAPEGIPDWIPTIPIVDEDGEKEPVPHIICNDRDTLIYLANLGSIDLHPWLSRRGSLDTPDWGLIDLDAKDAPFPNVIKIAREVGKLLRGVGLRPYLKTSGASGIHILLPLAPVYTYDQTKLFCEAVARIVTHQHREIASVERLPGDRKGKVYLDFLQNRRSQTVVPPFVPRPKPGATISMPLDWDDLDEGLDPSHFTLRVETPVLARAGEIARRALADKQELGPAITALEAHLRTL